MIKLKKETAGVYSYIKDGKKIYVSRCFGKEYINKKEKLIFMGWSGKYRTLKELRQSLNS